MKKIKISTKRGERAKTELAKLKGKNIEQLSDVELRRLLQAIADHLNLLDDSGKIK